MLDSYCINQEQDELAFEERKRQREEEADARTAKNRAKRQKKKQHAKTKGAGHDESNTTTGDGETSTSDIPFKKRRMVNGGEVTFKRPGDESQEDDDECPMEAPSQTNDMPMLQATNVLRYLVEQANPAAEDPKIIIHEDN